VTRFDLLIRGGEVLDPGAGLEGRLDVAVSGERVAAVDRDIPAESAREVVDATGQLVLPGLVDLHTHVYRGATYWGIDPDRVAWRTGVTTWLDVGSAGAYTLAGFREWIAERVRVRVRALLNISSIGLVAPNWELANLDHLDEDLCRRLVEGNRDLVLGVKVRMGTPTVGANGLEPLRRARRVAGACELPLMVHIAHGPPAIDEVVELMRPGDVLTHCSTGASMRVVDDDGRVSEAVRRAWEAGVVLDVGHGAGSFSWRSAEALLAAGIAPDVISSDVHAVSVLGPMFDLPTCLAKLLALGMPLRDVVRAATARPTEVLGMAGEVGTLQPGAWADVALFRLERGPVPLYDVDLEMREGRELLRNTLTLVGGRRLPPALPEEPPPWVPLTPGQRAWLEEGRLGAAEPPALRLTRPEDLPAPPPVPAEAAR
jgi:dihydroorotase